MDTSKEYIKMCADAVEIQSRWNIKGKCYGDFFANSYKITQVLTPMMWLDDREQYIWLPRQDQLQEIINLNCFDCVLVYDNENQEWKMFYFQSTFRGKSPEQLWLAFIMKERFNKTWDGNTWQ